ncbi:hypothetical protein L1987_65637 [Smallanthus sonchifolius]|uniref:Uncharacterized protein n=1 Tax=Smallanthus sonchifolius TaxID=185202 RepID=A0ACB9BUX0_9ASTR|nr:hypothetical protein L1987_65637 [Smallanthus sonchifolius]
MTIKLSSDLCPVIEKRKDIRTYDNMFGFCGGAEDYIRCETVPNDRSFVEALRIIEGVERWQTMTEVVVVVGGDGDGVSYDGSWRRRLQS